MNDKKENLKSALDHTRKAMVEIDTAASMLMIKHKANTAEYDLLDDLYSVLVQAEQKLIRLKD